MTADSVDTARQVSQMYIDRKKLARLYLLEDVGRGFRGALYIFRNKPPPRPGPCLLLKGGGAYFQENTAHVGP